MLKNYKKHEFYFFRQSSIRTLPTRNTEIDLINNTDKMDLNKLMIENVEFKVLYLSRWLKVPFKIELSIESLDLEETRTNHIGNKKSSNFYSIPFKNVCSCTDLNLSANLKLSSNNFYYFIFNLFFIFFHS